MKYGCQSMVGKIESVLIKRPEDAYISQEHLDQNWEQFNYISSPHYETVLKEFRAFEKILRDNVKDVYELPRDKQTGLDSIYTHDPVKITKRGAIYFTMGKALRQQGEPAATRAYLESIGVPTLGEIKPPGTMEGGDVLWIDEDTVAIGRGYRTNDEGIRQFKELTKDLFKEYMIVPLPHGNGESEILHLMSLISFVDRDKAVVYSKLMPVFFRQYLIEKGVILVEASDKEYDYLGTNILALEPGKVIYIDGCPEVTGKLRSLGVEVLTYQGTALSIPGTGGPTCLTCPISRL